MNELWGFFFLNLMIANFYDKGHHPMVSYMQFSTWTFRFVITSLITEYIGIPLSLITFFYLMLCFLYPFDSYLQVCIFVNLKIIERGPER